MSAKSSKVRLAIRIELRKAMHLGRDIAFKIANARQVLCYIKEIE